MLLASSTGGLGNLIAMLILIVGFTRMFKILKGDVVKGPLKQGLSSVIGRIFKR